MSSSLPAGSVVARRSPYRQPAFPAAEVALGSLRWAACMSFTHNGAALGSSRWPVRIGPYYGLAAFGSLRGSLCVRFSHACAPWQRQGAGWPVGGLRRRALAAPILRALPAAVLQRMAIAIPGGGGGGAVARLAAPQFSAGLGFRRVGLARVAGTPRANLAVHRTLRDKAAQRR